MEAPSPYTLSADARLPSMLSAGAAAMGPPAASAPMNGMPSGFGTTPGQVVYREYDGGAATPAYGASYGGPATPAYGASYVTGRPMGAESYGGNQAYADPYLRPQVPGQFATVGVDTNGDGRANYVIPGADRNNDGIPDALEGATRYGIPSSGSFVAEPVTRSSPLQSSGSFVAEPYSRSGAPIYTSQTMARAASPRERYQREYRSVSPLPSSASPSYSYDSRYDSGQRAGYREGQPVYRSRSADTRGRGSYSPEPYGAPPVAYSAPPTYAYGAETSSYERPSYASPGYGGPGYSAERGPGYASPAYGGAPAANSYTSNNYYGGAPREYSGAPREYSGGPRGYTAGDTYSGGSVSYGPPPGQEGGYAGGYNLPTSGSFVAEPYALGAPPPMNLLAERPISARLASSSVVAPYGAGGFSDFNYGTAPPGSYPASSSLLPYGGYGGGPGGPAPSSPAYPGFGAGGPPPGGLGGFDMSLAPDPRQPPNNYYGGPPGMYGSPPMATSLQREEIRREDNAFEAGAKAQADIDKAELSKKGLGAKPTSSPSSNVGESKKSDGKDGKDGKDQRRTKKRHGYQCLGC